jgi:hypothetical protein
LSSSRRRTGALLALAVFLVTGVIGGVVVRLQGSIYRSTAVLSIDQPAVLSTTAQPGPVLKLQTLRAQYAALLGTRTLVGPIASRVGRSASDVQTSLHAVAARNSLLVTVTGDGHDRAAARALTEAAADVLIQYVSQSQADAFVPQGEGVVLRLLSPAGASQAVTGADRTVLTTGLFVGLVCAAGALVLASWVRTPAP